MRYYVYGDPEGTIERESYFWVLRRGDEVVLVDTGIDPLVRPPSRDLLVGSVEALYLLDIGVEDVSRTMVTHCDTDPFVSLLSIATVTVVVQKLAFWTSPTAQDLQFVQTVGPDQIEHLAQVVSDGRGVVQSGDAEVHAGRTVRLVGGRVPAHQLVEIESAVGTVVLASGAAHFAMSCSGRCRSRSRGTWVTCARPTASSTTCNTQERPWCLTSTGRSWTDSLAPRGRSASSRSPDRGSRWTGEGWPVRASKPDVADYFVTLSNWGRWGAEEMWGRNLQLVVESGEGASGTSRASTGEGWACGPLDTLPPTSMRWGTSFERPGLQRRPCRVRHHRVRRNPRGGHILTRWTRRSWWPAPRPLPSAGGRLPPAGTSGGDPAGSPGLRKVPGGCMQPGDAVFVRTGSTRAEELHAGTVPGGALSGLTPDCLPLLRERYVALLWGDGVDDPRPDPGSGVRMRIHAVDNFAMGLWLLDYVGKEELGQTCAVLDTWQFCLVVTALKVQGTTGSLVNSLASPPLTAAHHRRPQGCCIMAPPLIDRLVPDPSGGSSRWADESGRVADPQLDQVLGIDLQAILVVDRKPGQRLVERELIEHLEVSRTKDREVLARLTAEGLVTTLGQKGAIVIVLSRDEAAETYEMRGALEVFAVRRFIERALDAQFDALVASLHDIEQLASDASDPAKKLCDKGGLYEVLLAGASSPSLAQVLSGLQGRVRVLRATSLSTPGRLVEAVAEIRRVEAAVIARDVERASEGCLAHIRKAAKTGLARLAHARADEADETDVEKGGGDR